MTSFSIQSFGCRVNQAEAFEWASELQELGWTLTARPETGGVIIVNTCTLTAHADRDVRKFLRRAGREHPGSRIVVTGCLAERAPGGLASMPGVWKVVSNRDKAGLIRVLLGSGAAAGTRAVPAPDRFRARAFLKVQDGCDMRCAFCVIPAVRGTSRSVPLAAAVERAGRLAAKGYAEIVLTGIRLCAYGLDLDPRSSLLDLLRALEAIEPRPALRLSSLDPRLMPGPFVGHLAAAAGIRPHFHLSLQHAAPERLAAMGRNSTAAEYEALLAGLHSGRPEAALGADFIVGFPGETEAEFKMLVDFVESSPLTYLHVFAYSPRPGVPSETSLRTGSRVPSSLLAKRAARLRAIGARKDRAFRLRFVGRELPGIVIGPAGEGVEVLTANGISVTASGLAPARGDQVRVRILESAPRQTRGELIGGHHT
jgi:threonylcarbamoyladenosine tRNA methylthiotransferase MtaB